MKGIDEIIQAGRSPQDEISDLKQKNIILPPWSKLETEYNPKEHSVITDKSYKDKPHKNGTIEKVTRITYSLQKLAVKRMTELMFAIPVKRVYKPEDDDQKKVAAIMEAIYKKNHINSVNIERGRNLFASCENCTIWYSQEMDTIYAGEKSKLKLRCKNYSPRTGDELYPLFDDYDDLIALSIGYSRVEQNMQKTEYFDTYTADHHYRWINRGTDWEVDEDESITIEKIQGIYISRPEPIWEDQTNNISELEWSMSRQGNYLRKNSRPAWVIFTDQTNPVSGKEADKNAGRDVLTYPKDAKAGYVTWEQAIESLKFHCDELKRNFFTTLQLPDMSMDQMKATTMSGEARKMLFIDCQLKCTDEAGAWLEFFDREVNVVKAFMKAMFPGLKDAIDALSVENVITPFEINDESSTITDYTNATGGAAIASQKTAIQKLGWVDDVDEELQQIQNESNQTADIFANEPTK
jgi:hypothetical protein